MIKKKYFLILIILILVFSSLFIITNVLTGYYSVTGYYPNVEKKTNVESTLNSLIKGKERILLEFKQDNTCYWIRSTRNKTNFLLEIIEYENTENIKGCLGLEKKTSYVVIDSPINLYGKDCICDNEEYLLELETKININHLKISKSPPQISTWQRVSIGVKEFFQNLVRIFTRRES